LRVVGEESVSHYCHSCNFSGADLWCAADFLNKGNCQIHITNLLIERIRKASLTSKENFPRLSKFFLQNVDFANQQIRSDLEILKRFDNIFHRATLNG